MCEFTEFFCNSSFATEIFEVIDFIQKKKNIEKIPKDIPILLIAGDEDPVGNYGEGVYAVSNWLISTGHNVKTQLYAGYRHEIHNYDEIKEEVEEGIIDFMDDVIGLYDFVEGDEDEE